MPENNKGIHLVPQILTKSSEAFIKTANELAQYGYQEVNLNLGCPSPTVTTKKKGAGMLGDLPELERFLDEIFEKTPVEISIKTRLGLEQESEWEKLLSLYEKYPIKELIIHARLLKDFYNGTPRHELYAYAKNKPTLGNIQNLCYNGDIFTLEDYEKYKEDTVMLGRGVLRNPALSVEIRNQYPEEHVCQEKHDTPGHREQQKEITPDIWAFHDALIEGYSRELSGDYPLIQKMKELWSYMITGFPNSEKQLKAIRKATHKNDYEAAVNILRNRQ